MEESAKWNALAHSFSAASISIDWIMCLLAFCAKCSESLVAACFCVCWLAARSRPLCIIISPSNSNIMAYQMKMASIINKYINISSREKWQIMAKITWPKGVDTLLLLFQYTERMIGTLPVPCAIVCRGGGMSSAQAVLLKLKKHRINRHLVALYCEIKLFQRDMSLLR